MIVIEDAAKNKMVFVLALCVMYCGIMTIICGVYYFGGVVPSSIDDVCYATNNS